MKQSDVFCSNTGSTATSTPPRHPERQDLQRLIFLLQRNYYQVRQEGLTAEIKQIEKQLATSDVPVMETQLSDDSIQLPNVITDADRLRMQAIGAKHAIAPPATTAPR